MLSSSARVRASAAAVVQAAAHVHVDEAHLKALATALAAAHPDVPSWDDGGVHFADDVEGEGALTAAYIFVLDTLNWCFWPSTSGLEYDDLARGLRDVLRRDPTAFSPLRLCALTEGEVAAWLAPHDLPNLPTRVAFLRELGQALQSEWAGSALVAVRGCRNSAVALVDALVRALPNLRDEAVHARLGLPGTAQRVFMYKRAQILVADLWAAFGRRVCTAGEAGMAHPAAFYDISELTCFPDYRLPQVLRHAGVLVYSPPLASAVDAQQQLPAGGVEEVEIRAATVVAVERLRKTLESTHGRPMACVELDWRLWQIGEAGVTTGDRALARDCPHHRCDTTFY
jgi:hypothetical protein